MTEFGGKMASDKPLTVVTGAVYVILPLGLNVPL